MSYQRTRIGTTSLMLLLAALTAPIISLFTGLAIAPLFAVLMAVALVQGMGSKLLAFPTHPIVLCIVLFSAWAFVSCFWSPNADDALEQWSATFSLLLVAVMTWPVFHHLSERQAERAGMALVAGMIVTLILIVVELCNSGSIYIYAKAALFGQEVLLFNPEIYNRGACFLAVIVWPMVLYLSRSGRAGMFVALGILLCMFAALLCLESLSAKAGLAAGIVAFALASLAPKFIGRTMLAAVLVSYLLIPLAAGKIEPKEYMMEGVAPSALHRLFIWDFTESKAREKPWIGWGYASSKVIPGGQEPIILPNQSTPEDWTYLPRHPHNALLQIWLELGIVGVVLTALMLIVAYYWLETNIRGKTARACYLAFFSAYYVVGLSAFNVWQEWWVATWLLGLLLLGIFTTGHPGGVVHRLTYRSRL